MLRLPSRTALMHDQLMRYRTRHVGTKIFFYHGQSQVQTGCHAGRCPDGSVDDENPVIFNLYVSKSFLQGTRKSPVRGSPAAGQQTRFCQDKSARADGRNTARASTDVL